MERMSTKGLTSNPWFLFCRWRFPVRTEISFVRGSERIAATFATGVRGWDWSATGVLLGAPFSIEAFSRRRLEGDTSDSLVPLFEGTFDHTDGASGTFTAKPRTGGELLALGVYGSAQTIRVYKIDPDARVCPVEVFGIPGLRVRLEEPPFSRGHLYSRKDIPKPPGPGFYVGTAIPDQESDATKPPAIAVLTTLVFCYRQIITNYYVKDYDPA
jgi:hypothetical protein